MFIFINYKQNANPDHELATKTEAFLRNEGYKVFRDENKLKGGQNWPQEILDNLKKADCMLCFISNSSMRSQWVLNEIDEMLSLNKPLIPVMLEPLNKQLNFTKYRPRFGDIQYIDHKGNFENVSAEIIKSLKELGPEDRLRQILPYHKIVSTILAKHGFDNSDEIICWFLEFLQDFHVVFAASAELHPIRRIPKLIGEGTCRSITESIVLAVSEYSRMHKHNFENGKKTNREHNWWWEERVIRSACLAEILETVITKWQPYVDLAKKQMASRKKTT
jgi:TIR domain